jgi:hypothetical protein
VVIGKSDKALTWMTFAGVASLIGTEVGRRMMKNLASRPGPAQGIGAHTD